MGGHPAGAPLFCHWRGNAAVRKRFEVEEVTMAKNISKRSSEKDTERLPIRQSDIKRLFAYSGNQCAVPKCKAELVDDGGTMLGKIAHIHAAKNGARYDKNMDDEQRREISNLIVVCGLHHDIIDDRRREDEFPPDLLKEWKKNHESRFRRAERDFLEQYQDNTLREPVLPENLKALQAAFGFDDEDLEAELDGWLSFIEKLRLTPNDIRQFALNASKRMINRKQENLPVEEVMRVFSVGESEMKTIGNLLYGHDIGEITDLSGYGEYVVRIFERNPGGNPFIEIVEFCERTGNDSETLVFDLDFSSFDM